MCLRVFKISECGTSLVVQGLRLHASNVKGAGSIPGQGTKMPHAMQPEKGKKISKREYISTQRPQVHPGDIRKERPISLALSVLKRGRDSFSSSQRPHPIKFQLSQEQCPQPRISFIHPQPPISIRFIPTLSKGSHPWTSRSDSVYPPESLCTWRVATLLKLVVKFGGHFPCIPFHSLHSLETHLFDLILYSHCLARGTLSPSLHRTGLNEVTWQAWQTKSVS